ncbi:MAG: Gfo/Idh/MocA family oxidoreductase [Acidimicrobiia bacterium]|nr:Gfo/Idh/MocA family oxidoreductase [Acidimicrobiia bacterium]
MLNFAVTGVGGFVAPRHLRAIRATGHRVVAAVDPHDAVGVLDQFAPDARFFTEFERFDRHLDKLRRGPDAGRVHVVSVCSPNYLHDAHVRTALRSGADVICEKPLVINPWNLDALQQIEAESGRRVFTVLQLRLHPAIVALSERVRAEPARGGHQVELTYVTPRGPWYDISWKGSEERSGGVVTNIGIHLFDLLVWIFGRVEDSVVHLRERRKAAGALRLDRAEVRWFLSTDHADLPGRPDDVAGQAVRAMSVDGHDVDFSHGLGELHTEVYRDTLDGRGCGIEAARPSIELTHRIRQQPVQEDRRGPHAWFERRLAAR